MLHSGIKVRAVMFWIHGRKRSSYYQGIIKINRNQGFQDIIHEIGHAIDSSNQSIRRLVLDFFATRTAGHPPERLDGVSSDPRV